MKFQKFIIIFLLLISPKEFLLSQYLPDYIERNKSEYNPFWWNYYNIQLPNELHKSSGTRSTENDSRIISSVNNDSLKMEWAKYYLSGQIPKIDKAIAVKTDRLGNVYVTGSSENLPNGYDIVTIKYDSTGNGLWAVIFDGQNHSDDFAVALDIDGSGNIYVTGRSSYIHTVTVKYNSGGEQLWIAKEAMSPTAMKVDKIGNVYITGSSSDGNADADYKTIKYDTDGFKLWYNTFSGPGTWNSYNAAKAIDIDNSGNVYVTGSSSGYRGLWWDHYTVKYDKNGTQLWAVQYNSGGNPCNWSDGIVVDDKGNVYTIGTISGNPWWYDYLIVKYDSSGNQIWMRRYDNDVIGYSTEDYGKDIIVDNEENVYVTGRSSGNVNGHDVATIKLDRGGNIRWVARYNYEAGDDARGIELDSLGYIYALSNKALIKYDTLGNQIYTLNFLEPPYVYGYTSAMNIDSKGNLYVTGYNWKNTTAEDYITMKIDADGMKKWTSGYNGGTISKTAAVDATIDNKGYLYVLSKSEGLNTKYDFLTIKYSPTGNICWEKRYNGAANLMDEPVAITVDKQGNVYVTGHETFWGSWYLCYTTIKYDSSGDIKWIRKYFGPNILSDITSAIKVDDNGHVYVTGSSSDEVGWSDIATIKYDANGNQVWVARYSAPGNNSDDYAVSLDVDKRGYVYVVGNTKRSGTSYDFITIAYDSNGTHKWTKTYSSVLDKDDFAKGIKADDLGNVYVIGTSINDICLVFKYDALGNVLWENSYDYRRYGNDVPVALTLDDSSNIYVTGYSYDNNQDIFTLKLNPNGEQIWVVRYNGETNSDDYPSDITVDGFGNVYITGKTKGINSYDIILTIQYDKDGNLKTVVHHDSPWYANEGAIAISLHGTDIFYVVGNLLKYDNWAVPVVIKYTKNPLSVSESEQMPIQYQLFQNYPNPFNPTTIIKYQLPENCHVTLKIYDLIGREVAKLLNEFQIAGNKSIEFNAESAAGGLPTGVYFYKLVVSSSNSLNANNYTSIKKMLLIR
ncbi:MAG: SBBP repeat-containing protein [Bacteroidota bacterium]|nr:SBBP repeat-containing protein [Bacteroidota bacterium]